MIFFLGRKFYPELEVLGQREDHEVYYTAFAGQRWQSRHIIKSVSRTFSCVYMYVCYDILSFR